MARRTGIGILLLAGLGVLAERSDAGEKDQYHLFNPTPPSLMRPLSADRPDATESPYTVDAGHFQVELSFAEYARDEGVDQFKVLPVNLKIGLTNDADFQLLLDPHVRIEEAGDAGAIQGLGDTQARLKINLWGNDGGPFAIGFMPFLQFPGDDDLSTGRLEGGLILPVAFELAGGWDLGVQAEVDFLRDESNADYGLALVHTAALGHGITGPLDGFIEYVGIAPHDLGTGYEAYGSAGVTWGVSDDVQFDLGVIFGLSESATDGSAFTGLTFRL